MQSRHLLNGPDLRALRRGHGFPSATLFGRKVGLSPSQVYDLEKQRTTATEAVYVNILHLFGLDYGALKATGNPCPHCGHVETGDRKSPQEVTDGA